MSNSRYLTAFLARQRMAIKVSKSDTPLVILDQLASLRVGVGATHAGMTVFPRIARWTIR